MVKCNKCKEEIIGNNAIIGTKSVCQSCWARRKAKTMSTPFLNFLLNKQKKMLDKEWEDTKKVQYRALERKTRGVLK